MTSERTNLLPKDRIRAFRRNYALRLLTVSAIFLTGLIFIHGVLLLPSYLYVDVHAHEQEKTLQELTVKLEVADEQSVRSRFTALSEDATYLTRLSSVTTASIVLRTILAIPRQEILLFGIVFSAPSNAIPSGRVRISGIAETREVLRNYVTVLERLSGVTQVDLPIGAYAKETDIAFTITLIGLPIP